MQVRCFLVVFLELLHLCAATPARLDGADEAC